VTCATPYLTTCKALSPPDLKAPKRRRHLALDTRLTRAEDQSPPDSSKLNFFLYDCKPSAGVTNIGGCFITMIRKRFWQARGRHLHLLEGLQRAAAASEDR